MSDAIQRSAAEAGGAMPAVLNAANEVAVAAFLAGKLTFTGIVQQVEATMARYSPAAPQSLGDVIEIDAEARRIAAQFLEPACGK